MHSGGPPVPPPPPPPPPPLLPPPPPPPPPGSGLLSSHHGPGFIGRGNHRRSRMRNFNWETLPKHSVIGKHNIWTADKPDGGYELDTDHMEELFSHSQGQQQHNVLKRSSVRGLPASGTGGEMVSILSSKRSMNIGIFLKQFKRPVKDMIEDIKSGRGLSFGYGKLRELCRLLPDEGEVKQLLHFKGDLSALPEADLFMLLLVKIPSYEERLTCLVLKEEFFPLMDEMKEFIGTLTSAGMELLECENLHSVIRLVLKTGNYMNAGGYAGSAVGFRMASLLKLADTKANKPGMNLMHYVVIQAQKADRSLLNFPEQLQHIEAAARIKKSEIDTEFERQLKKVQNAKENTLKQEDLQAQMEDFLKDAEVCLAEMETSLQELQSVSDSVAEYFCEDPNKFKLEECCSVFNSFCAKFLRAMQENKAREVADTKKRHIDRLQNTAKRRSTATCSSRDKEMDGIALEHVLQNFLTNRVSRRRSGKASSAHGTPVSGSPTNESLTEISSQMNLPAGNQKRGDVFRVKKTCKKEWNSATELTENFPVKKTHSHVEESREKRDTVHKEEIKTNRKEDSTHPTKKNTTIFSKGKSFSASTEDDEEDVQANEREAQKLREASKKVLRFQNSRSSVSSGEFSLENQKSPAATSSLRRQLTFDEETQRYPGDPTNEDLVQFLLNTESSSQRNFSRRHTLPTKIPITKEEKDNRQTQPTVKSPNHVAHDKRTQPGDGAGDTSSNPSHNSGGRDLSSPAEKKSKPNDSSAHVSDRGSLEQSKEEKSKEHTGTHPQTNSEKTPPKSTWFKTETSGLFFSFFKRLGDMSKPQSSKEAVHTGTDTSV